jgi:diguanylate cyclase (GGDEF)-like protein
VTSRLAAWIRRDLLRAVRLAFLAALALVAAVSVTQIALADHLSPRTTALTLLVLASSFVLRVIEYRTDRPVAPLADLVELAGLMTVLALVRNIDALLGTLFFLVLCRSAVSRLSRLLPLVSGFVAGWIVVSRLVPQVEIYAGAVLALPIVGLLVFVVRTLMLRLQAQHAEQSALLDAVLTRLPFPVVVLGHAGEVLLSNPAATALTGSADLDGLEVRGPAGEPIDLRRLDTRGTGVEARLTRADGGVAYVSAETVPMHAGTVIALLDVTAQRLYEEHLHHAAYHDALTGLPNRALLWQRLEAARRSGSPYAVLLVDLDRFKAVNDTLGHQAGDELLRGVAQRFTHVAGASATVARLGGDEFAVLLSDARTADAEAVAAGLRSCFAWPFPLSTGPLEAAGTVGYALAGPGQSPDEVLAAADRAMYREKPGSALRGVRG